MSKQNAAETPEARTRLIVELRELHEILFADANYVWGGKLFRIPNSFYQRLANAIGLAADALAAERDGQPQTFWSSTNRTSKRSSQRPSPPRRRRQIDGARRP